METPYAKVLALLSSPDLLSVENALAERAGTSVSKGNLEVFARLVQQEIEMSPLSCDEISASVKDDPEFIIKFGVALLREEDAEEQRKKSPPIEKEQFAPGFGITYAIYVHFLRAGMEPELVDYLKQRRIPGAKDFAKRLQQLYAEVTTSS